MRKPNPRCPFNAKKCFAYCRNNGGCKILENTDFDLWKGCPFYKTNEQYEDGNPDVNGTDLSEMDEEEVEL